jgi:DNA-binding beta-propeller fold protein YncE
MKTATLAIALLLCTLWLNHVATCQTGGRGYHIVDSLRLGGDGGWDYLTVDTAAQRLYVSRGSRVQVVDLTKLSVIGEIPNTPGVHGVAVAPSLGRGYTSNGRDSSVTVFDLGSLKELTRIRIDGRNPDAILFDPFSGRVFTFNGGSANASAIETETNTVVGTVPLEGKPEFAVSDGAGRIYVNIEDKSELVAFDARTLKILKRSALAPGEEPSGLAMDREQQRLYSVCGNRLMVIVDAHAGTIAATVPIGGGVDGAAYDQAEHLAFSSNGEGTLTVVKAEGSDKYSVVENVPTRRSARTLTIDPKTHRIYTVAARFGFAPQPTPDRPRPRPPIEPGSVTLYVLGR